MLAKIITLSLLITIVTCVIEAAAVDPTGKFQMCARNRCNNDTLS